MVIFFRDSSNRGITRSR